MKPYGQPDCKISAFLYAFPIAAPKNLIVDLKYHYQDTRTLGTPLDVLADDFHHYLQMHMSQDSNLLTKGQLKMKGLSQANALLQQGTTLH